jgi:hypothetical protein
VQAEATRLVSRRPVSRVSRGGQPQRRSSARLLPSAAAQGSSLGLKRSSPNRAAASHQRGLPPAAPTRGGYYYHSRKSNSITGRLFGLFGGDGCVKVGAFLVVVLCIFFGVHVARYLFDSGVWIEKQNKSTYFFCLISTIKKRKEEAPTLSLLAIFFSAIHTTH